MTRRRLFFALWPDDATRRALAKAARHWTRYPVSSANLHLTLVFLGACDEARQQCSSAAAATVACEPFELELDYLGGWPRSAIQWLGSSRAPAALAELVTALQASLEPCGFVPEKRRFVPHITLSRRAKAPRTQANLPPLSWQVNEFVLVESLAVEAGVRYQVRERWALTGG